MNDADSILVSFLRSTGESEQNRLLDDLILVHAAPLIRQTIWRKFGWYLNQAGAGSSYPNAPDAEDIYNEIVLNLIQRLRNLQQHGDVNSIRNFRQYVVRVAENGCHNHLRLKSRARYHLKDTLRNLLHRRREFKTWRGDGNDTLCGLAAWNKRMPHVHAPNRLELTQEIVEKLKTELASDANLRRARLAGLVTQILLIADQPIELDDLTEIVASLLNITDQPPESLDQNELLVQQLPSSNVGADVSLEGREKLREFWTEVLQLSRNQRIAICLSFADKNGDDLLSVLLEAKITTPAQFAQSLGLTDEQVWSWWNEMPMKNAVIAAHLGVTSEEIGKRLYLARKELRTRLFGTERTK